MTGSNEPVKPAFGTGGSLLDQLGVTGKPAGMTQEEYEKQANQKRRDRIMGTGEQANPADTSWYDQKRAQATKNEKATDMDQVNRGVRSYDSYDKKYNQ